MLRRHTLLALILALVVIATGCKNKTSNPIANVDSKQPDKVLFDRAMDALKRNKFDVARLTLQTLINTYPDSEFIARAKLGVADSWLAENTTAALQQAEVELKDFQTFFPNMPEAAESQLKIADIHYKQMEKPDRDYTHAKRAEDEYRQLILQYPDSVLVQPARQRLRQVQEVLGEREFRIGRFYYIRESYPAAIARLKSLIDAYPLYSQVDEALYMLGQTYEAQMDNIRAARINETDKANLLSILKKEAGSTYSKIITRYPAMERADPARERLKDLGMPVPTPTAEALAQSKAEEESRGETGRMGQLMLNFKKRPDMARTATVGEPSLNDPQQTNAPDVLKNLIGAPSGTGEKKVSVETIKDGPATNEAAPRSDDGAQAPPPAPAPTNDVNSGDAGNKATDSSSAPQGESSSKKKKIKGLRKLIPFGN
ncbi:MAG TPA: outer membrane protein assembly factor BamD [Terriglobales bacterium]|nr:outer membrane protein assembly factor BamD [Terriglobales bacterium]